jgi:heme/copper-type cytochrome/quinol oxidase subunit 1
VLGQLHFWIFFIGVNILFFPMHFLGLQGMQRRVPDYTDALAYWNAVASHGYEIMAVGVVIFFVNMFWSLVAGKKAATIRGAKARRRSNGRCPARRPTISSRRCPSSTEAVRQGRTERTQERPGAHWMSPPRR